MAGAQLLLMGHVEEMIFRKTTVEEVNSCASKDGEYRAIEEIGNGAFGTVFRARNRQGRVVAIKICKTDVGFVQMLLHGFKLSDRLLQQALEEARCLNRLRHRHVLQLLDVYDFTSERGGKGIALVTEYCAKGSLQQYLEKYRPGEEKRFKWCRQLAISMQYIHSKGITHRDIKPANILIDSDDDMKIGDVGFAKAAWGYGTAVNGVRDVSFQTYMCTKAGTPAYMAPEVWDEHYTKESDIFSLGLVFVMMVESPAVLPLVPHARYAGERKVLGQMMHDDAKARSCRPTDLLQFEIKHATRAEVRLFNRMLECSYYKRPNAEEVVEEIEDMNKSSVGRSQPDLTAALFRAIAERERRPRVRIISFRYVRRSFTRLTIRGSNPDDSDGSDDSD